MKELFKKIVHNVINNDDYNYDGRFDNLDYKDVDAIVNSLSSNDSFWEELEIVFKDVIEYYMIDNDKWNHTYNDPFGCEYLKDMLTEICKIRK